MSMVGRLYLDPGDRLSGRRQPEPVTVLQQWRGPSRTNPPAPCPAWLLWARLPRPAPRNVLIARASGQRVVIPSPRRLRRPPEGPQ